jgi:hypothetical protein
MIALLGFVGQFLQLIPGLTSLGQSWVKGHFDAQTQQIQAKLKCDADMAVAVLQMQGEVQSRWWFVAIIPPAFAIPFVLYVWRCVVYDNVIMGGATSTPALGGILATVFIMIVTFYFAAGHKNV